MSSTSLLENSILEHQKFSGVRKKLPLNPSKYLHRTDDSPRQKNLVMGLAHNAGKEFIEVKDWVNEGDVVGHHNGGSLFGCRLPNAMNPMKPAKQTTPQENSAEESGEMKFEQHS